MPWCSAATIAQVAQPQRGAAWLLTCAQATLHCPTPHPPPLQVMALRQLAAALEAADRAALDEQLGELCSGGEVSGSVPGPLLTSRQLQYMW